MRAWYGYQTLAVDGSAFLFASYGSYVAVTEAQADSSGAVLGGLVIAGLAGVSYVLVPPIIHWAHGRMAAGFTSLGIRVLFPVAGLGVGALASEIANGSRNQVLIPIGGAAGMVAASAVDAGFLGWETTNAPATMIRTMMPKVILTRRKAFVGVSASF